MEYYSPKILIGKNVIEDVLSNITPDTKMLVFGLGYDSKMWYNATNKKCFFVENNDSYINLNKNDIDSANIIKYNYTTKCATCLNLKDEEIQKFEVPCTLLENGPFDIIIIDGPIGYGGGPGRLIPTYWSSVLTKPGTLVYMDDSSRPIEKYCISKYYEKNVKHVFKYRNNECTKIICPA